VAVLEILHDEQLAACRTLDELADADPMEQLRLVFYEGHHAVLKLCWEEEGEEGEEEEEEE
jgi:hypothetical protein